MFPCSLGLGAMSASLLTDWKFGESSKYQVTFCGRGLARWHCLEKSWRSPSAVAIGQFHKISSHVAIVSLWIFRAIHSSQILRRQPFIVTSDVHHWRTGDDECPQPFLHWVANSGTQSICVPRWDIRRNMLPVQVGHKQLLSCFGECPELNSYQQLWHPTLVVKTMKNNITAKNMPTQWSRMSWQCQVTGPNVILQQRIGR